MNHRPAPDPTREIAGWGLVAAKITGAATISSPACANSPAATLPEWLPSRIRFGARMMILIPASRLADAAFGTGGRFVQQKHRIGMNDTARDIDPLLLAARKGRRR